MKVPKITARLRALKPAKKIHYLVIAGASLILVGGIAATIASTQHQNVGGVFTATTKMAQAGSPQKGANTNTDIANAAQSGSTSSSSSSNTASDTANNKTTKGLPFGSSRPEIPPLIASPSSLLLKNGGAYFEVTHPNKGIFSTPTATQPAGTEVLVNMAYDTSVQSRQSWTITVWQKDKNSSGQGIITVRSSGYSVNVPVSWKPVPEVQNGQSSFVRSDNPENITYTGTFSINAVNFTAAKLTIKTTGPCINSADLVKVVSYAGQSSLTAVCVIKREAVPSDGPATIKVSVVVDVPGTGILPSEPTFEYVVKAPYNQ